MDWRRNHFPIDHCFTAGEPLPLRHNYGLKTFDLDQLRKALVNRHITAHLKKWLISFKDDRGPFARGMTIDFNAWSRLASKMTLVDFNA